MNKSTNESAPAAEPAKAAPVECEPVGYMLTELSGQPREDDGELYVYSHPFACNEKTDCRPVYFHPQQPIDEETRRMVLELLTVLDYAMFEFTDTEQKVRELKSNLS